MISKSCDLKIIALPDLWGKGDISLGHTSWIVGTRTPCSKLGHPKFTKVNQDKSSCQQTDDTKTCLSQMIQSYMSQIPFQNYLLGI